MSNTTHVRTTKITTPMSTANLSMIFKLGYRNLLRDYKRSAILTFAIITGVAGLAFFQMLNDGFIQMMVGTIVNSSIGHIQIHQKDYSIDLDPVKTLTLNKELKKILKDCPYVKEYSPRIVTNCLVSSSNGSYPTLMKGIDKTKEANITDINSKLTFGELPEVSDDKSITIGNAMARHLKVLSGDRIVVMTRNIDGTMESGSFIVTGLFKAQSAQSEMAMIFLSTKGAMNLLGLKMKDQKFHEIAIKLHTFEDYKIATKLIKNQLSKNTDILVQSWAELRPIISGQIELVWVSTLIMFSIVFVALSFGIFNSFMIEIYERTREFGIMMAIGAKRRTIMFLLLTEAFLIGLTGAVAGLFSAWFCCHILMDGILDLSFWGNAMSHFDFSSSVPLVLTTKMIALSLTATVTITVLATIYPAIKAALYRPLAKAMRS